MNVASILIGIALGLAAGLIFAIAWARKSSEASAASAGADAAAARERAAALESELVTQRAQLGASQQSTAGLAAQLEAERRSATEKLEVLARAQEDLRNSFKALSGDALKASNESFLQLAEQQFKKFQEGAKSDLEARQTSITELLKPVNEQLKNVGLAVGKIELAREGAYKTLLQQVTDMGKSQEQLKGETANLVKALRAPKTRGRWGEIQLERVVEMAGMLDHCDFVREESVNTEDGRLRPDLKVHLPGGKLVVVDAKTPLEAYLDALEAPDDATREARMLDHARQVSDHITKLSRKNYWDQFEQAPEFVVMFLPGEMFFSAALEHDPSLIETGVKNKVILASPTTLISLLRAVHYGWQQERITENAQLISELGKEIYERLSVLGEHFDKVGKGLEGAVSAYNSAASSLETRVLVTGRKIKELGVGTARDIDEVRVIDESPRELQAPEFRSLPSGNGSDFQLE